MSALACVCCDRPVSSGFLCRDGVRKLKGHLRSVPALVEALEEAITRQVRFGAGGGGSTETPLVFNSKASEVLTDLTSYLEVSAALVADHAGQPVRWPGASASAAYILTQAHQWPTWQGVALFYGEFEDLRIEAFNVVDRPSDPVYLGHCSAGCNEILWAYDDAEVATCKRCSREHIRADREAEISERIRAGMVDRVMTATDAAEVLIAEGIASGEVSKLVDRIRKWATRKPPVFEGGPTKRAELVARVEIVRPGQRGRPGYRLGDVIDLLNAAEERRTKTTTKEEAPMTETHVGHTDIDPGVRLRFDGLTRSWLVRAVDEDGRYAIATAAEFGRVLYTVIDCEEQIRGAVNVIGGGVGIKTLSGPDPKISEALDMLKPRHKVAVSGSEVPNIEGGYEISSRNRVPLVITGYRASNSKVWA